MTIPAVRLPKDGGVRTPIDAKLKSNWFFEPKRRMFRSEAGEQFSPRGELPKGTRIVYKVSTLAGAEPSKLNQHERELRRYIQVILPGGESPTKYLQAVRAWPPVEMAHVGPEISLPT